MMTQLQALGQWEVVDGSIKALMPAIPNHPTPDKTCEINTWKLQVAHTYAKIALWLDNDYGEAITTINDPHDAWMMLESSYGSQKLGIQTVINAELTLAKWDSQTPITTHCDHMKALRTHLAGAGLTILPIQFYNHFANSLLADYNMVVAIHDPILTNYSIDMLCE